MKSIVPPKLEASSAKASHLHLCALLQAGLATLLGLFYFGVALTPALPLSDGLDPSWQISLAWAAEHQLQFGPEFAFTYGPLGYLECLFQLESTVGAQVWWQLVTRGIVTAFVIYSAWSWPNRWLGLGWIIIVAFWAIWTPEIFHGLFAVAISVIFTARRVRPELAAFVGILFGAFALIKFSTTVLLIFSTICLAATQLRDRSPANALGLVLGFCVGFLGGWIVSGQAIGNLPTFLRTSYEVATGYNAAMGLPSERAPLMSALVSLSLFSLALIYTALRLWRENAAANKAGVVLIVAAATFLLWKYGFIRADFHMLGFFAWIVVASPVVLAMSWRRDLLGTSSIVALLLVAAGALATHTNAVVQHKSVPALLSSHIPRALGNIQRTVALASSRNARANYNPAHSYLNDSDLSEVIGGRTVDMHGYNQAKLIANSLNFVPRPALQSYSAYTPLLTHLNAAHLQRPDGPEVVVMDYTAIDKRYPPLEDAAAFRQLLFGYRLVNVIENTLVFERTQAQAPSPLSEPPQQVIHATLEESIELPRTNSALLWVSFDFEKTISGRIQEFFYKLPTPVLTIETSTGDFLHFNLPYKMARTPFLVSPIVVDKLDLISLLRKQKHTSLRRLRISMPSGTSGFRPQVSINLWHEDIASLPEASPDLQKQAFPEFRTPPLAFNTTFPPERRTLDGRGIVYLHAPASVVFRCNSGPGVLHLLYGILPEAYTSGKTDGIGIRILLRSETTQETLLYEHWLQPRKHAADQGPQPLQIPFYAPADAVITIELNPGPVGDTSWDWSYLSGVEIIPDETLQNPESYQN